MKKVNENIIVPVKREKLHEAYERIIAEQPNSKDILFPNAQSYYEKLKRYLELFELTDSQGFADAFISKYTDFANEEYFQEEFISKTFYLSRRLFNKRKIIVERHDTKKLAVFQKKVIKAQEKNIKAFFKKYTKFAGIEDMKSYYLS